MAERRPLGILDTSVVLALGAVDADSLPLAGAISALTLAELAAGPHASADPDTSARRQERLQLIESVFEPVPFDAAAARAYGRIYAAVVAAGRRPRGPRAVDMLIAATALARDIPLYTRNYSDFSAVESLVDLVGV